MRIAIGMDHRGAATGRAMLEHLPAAGHEAMLLGPCDSESCDYPDVTWPVVKAVAAGEADFGVLVCGTGIGASIAANKVPGIRAALVHDEHAAEMSRRHNDANVICLPGDHLTHEQSCRLVDVFIATPFDGGRHARRVNKIAAMERGEDPVAVRT